MHKKKILMKLLFTIVLITFLFLTGSAQNNQETKAEQYNEIAAKTSNSDTMLKYALLALDLFEKSDTMPRAIASYYVGKAYYMLDEAEKAMPYFFQSANLCQLAGMYSKAATSYIAIGSCYEDLNIQDSIFYYYNKALKIFIEEKDTARISYAYLMIGQIQSNLELYSNAEENYRNALHYTTLSADTLDMAYCKFLIGQAIMNISDTLYYKSINDLKTSVTLFESIQTDDAYYIQGKYLAYSSLAEAYINAAKATGKSCYADSCKIYLDKIGNYDLDNGNISNHVNTCYTKAEYFMFYKLYTEALTVLNGLENYMTDDLPKNILKKFHKKLYDIYKLVGDYKKALQHFEKSEEYKFATLNDNTLTSIKKAEVERTKMIEELKRENAEKLHHAEKVKFQILITALIIGLGLGFIVFWNKRKSAKALAEKNTILARQRKEILDSINYAKRIQFAAISTIEEVKTLFPESFVYYRPCNIVSGDFYRVAKCGKYHVLITADCTGHGIPGGFLSMLGISALKEYCITENDAENPGSVLDRMRDFIKTTLTKDTNGKEVNDGMDITICSFDFSAMKMHYATANQTALLIRNGEIKKLKGDRMPVGRYLIEKEHFDSFSFDLEKGDIVYTFSDGIQDQPGGDEDELGKRFMSKNLFNLLKDNSEKPLDEQCKILDTCITNWRRNRSQVDDMTMIAVKV